MCCFVADSVSLWPVTVLRRCLYVCLTLSPDFVATELINKLNFLEDEDQEAPPAMSTNPFDEPDDDIHPNHLNPFGDPDEGTHSSVIT